MRLEVGAYDGELDVGWSDFATVLVDVLDPLCAVVEVVRRGADNLDVALLKVVRTTRNLAKPGRADRRKVSWNTTIAEIRDQPPGWEKRRH